jgi:3-oxoadipate enol-lactonase
VVHSNAWRAIRDLDFGDRLRSVATPALVLGGRRDRSVSPEVAQRVARSFGNGRYEEIDAGHLTPLERPELFAAALRKFASTVH